MTKEIKDTSKKERCPVPGIVIVIFAIAGAIAGGGVFVFWIYPKLPSGIYPTYLIGGLIVGCGLAFAGIGAMICKLFCFVILGIKSLIRKLLGIK